MNEVQKWTVYVAWVNAVEATKAASKNLPKIQLRCLTSKPGL